MDILLSLHIFLATVLVVYKVNILVKKIDILIYEENLKGTL